MVILLRDFVPALRQRLGMYVPGESFLTVSAFIAGYRWGSADGTLGEFQEWMAARGSGRPELGWPWLVLCEIYPAEDLPNPRHFTKEQDSAAITLLFDLLEEFYQSTRR